MQAVLEGFATIGTIIALGFLLAHVKILDLPSQLVLSRLAFFVASPALMITVLGRSDVGEVLSRNLAAQAGSVLVTGAVYVAVARLVWRKSGGDTVIGTLCAVYVNAGNLGLPIAAYVLGDASLVVPTLLMQMLFLQPLALLLLDAADAGSRLSLAGATRHSLTNPLTAGSLIGLGLALTGVSLPTAVNEPLTLVGGMAVPAMLLAYGVSLRLGPLPGAGVSALEIGLITVLKLGLQPATAYALGRYALDLDGLPLLAVTVLAALPTAQNIFVHATRYDRLPILARDSIFVTTVLSVPVLFVVAALLA